jgi:hypothetical protein
MSVTVYAPGISVEVIDRPVIVPPATIPPPTVTISQRTAGSPLAIIGAIQPDKFGHNNRVGWSDGGRYLREQQAIELKGTVTLCLFTEQVVLSPGVVGPMPFGFTGFISLWVGNVFVRSASVDATMTEVRITFDVSKFADGWYPVTVTDIPAPWDVAEYDMLIRNGTGLIDTMPVRAGSYSTRQRGGRFATCTVPAVFKPVEQPLPARDYPAFQTVSSMDQLTYTMLAPYRENDVYRPGMLPNGVMTTCNRQNYYYSDMQKPMPLWPLLSGPRGRGTITCPTSLRETGRPNSGKVTGTDPWRVFAVENDGTVRTLAGYEHDSATPPYTNAGTFTYWYGAGTPRLVGDWSAIPQNRRGFHELWDLAWYAPSLGLDPNAPPIGGEQPHLVNPVAFITDTQNGRVCRLEFDGHDRAAPPKITEFVTGLGKPWGCDFIGDVLYVSEQLGNRIQGYDVKTGVVVFTLPFTRPEGLRALDGDLYVGCLPSKAVWQVDPLTGASAIFCNVPVDGNSNFINLAVSDGTAFPRGSVATVTWSNTQFGWPCVFDPSGKRITTIQAISNFTANMTKGPVQPIDLSYASCVSLGDGRMTWGTVQEGLHRLSWALPTDSVPSAAAIAGQKKYQDQDLKLAYGDNGYGFYGLPLPTADAEIAAFLQSFGH